MKKLVSLFLAMCIAVLTISAIAEGVIYPSDSGDLYFYITENEYSICLYEYDVIGDDVVVPGSVVAQAIYDLSPKK